MANLGNYSNSLNIDGLTDDDINSALANSGSGFRIAQKPRASLNPYVAGADPELAPDMSAASTVGTWRNPNPDPGGLSVGGLSGTQGMAATSAGAWRPPAADPTKVSVVARKPAAGPSRVPESERGSQGNGWRTAGIVGGMLQKDKDGDSPPLLARVLSLVGSIYGGGGIR